MTFDMKQFTRDRVTLLHCDCLDYMKDIPDNHFDLAIIDPPYGIGMDGGNVGYKGFNNLPKKGWDNIIPDHNYFDKLERISKSSTLIC